MCGIHTAAGESIGHDHHDDHDDVGTAGAPARVFLPRPRQRTRRAFLGDFGAGTVAVALFTPTLLAACGSEADSDVGLAAAAVSPTGGSEIPTRRASQATAGNESDADLRWARTDLGFVSAYVLARGNTAAIVDTGTTGSAAAIGESLTGLGLNWSDVEHVILTHKHPDHIGSIDEVVAEAINATVYAGEADLSEIETSPVTGLVGGEDIFGFEAVATPGHTAGHMVVIDHDAGLLVAGDAIFGEGGGVAEGPERFFADVEQSRESIRQLAGLSFNTLLMGHGEPIEIGADTAVADLAASFG